MQASSSVLDSLPPKLVTRLMPFQKEGVEFAVKRNGRCLIADEMGLGKTLQALCVAYHYKAEWPLLLVVPSSLRYCWLEELERWLPEVAPQDINLIQAGNDAGGIAAAQVTVVTYGMLGRQTSRVVLEALVRQKFRVVICDESHYIRNAKTQVCKAVCPLIKAATRRLLLSGTPALARPAELYPQLDSLIPGEFGSWWNFTNRYCNAHYQYIGRLKKRVVDGASHLEELQARLTQKVMIRREKKDVLTQLPPKQRQKVIFELKDSSVRKDILKGFEELKPLLKSGRSQLAQALREEPMEDASSSGDSSKTLGLIQRLVKLTAEAKLGPVREYVDMLCENENLKFLVFAYHHVMMDSVQQTLYDKKVKFVRIDGQTPSSERQRFVQQFQSDPTIRVAILSIMAAGVGLTLTAAKLVVFAELYWTPGVMVQCEDRAHRIGQTSCVPVHYLVARATMDEWIWSAVCRKTLVTSKALSGRRGTLEADAGHHYQVALLSNAEAWRPANNDSLDISSLVLSQTPPGQKSILDFFGQSAKGSKSSEQRDHQVDIFSHCKKQKTTSTNLPRVILIDSDSDGEAFSEKEKNRKKHALVKKSSHESKGDFSKPKSKRCLGLDADAGDSLRSSDSEASSRSSTCKEKTDSGGEDPDSQDMEGQDGACSNFECQPQRTGSEKDTVPTRWRELDAGEHIHRPVKKQCHSDSSNRDQDGITCTDDGSLHDENRKDLSLAQAASPGEQSLSLWSCMACTFLNHQDLPFCEVCDTPKKTRAQSCSGRGAKHSKKKKKPLLDRCSVSRQQSSHQGDSWPVNVPNDGDDKNSACSLSGSTPSELLLPLSSAGLSESSPGCHQPSSSEDVEVPGSCSPDPFSVSSASILLSAGSDTTASSSQDSTLVCSSPLASPDAGDERVDGNGSGSSQEAVLTAIKTRAATSSLGSCDHQDQDGLPLLSHRGRRGENHRETTDTQTKGENHKRAAPSEMFEKVTLLESKAEIFENVAHLEPKAEIFENVAHPESKGENLEEAAYTQVKGENFGEFSHTEAKRRKISEGPASCFSFCTDQQQCAAPAPPSTTAIDDATPTSLAAAAIDDATPTSLAATAIDDSTPTPLAAAAIDDAMTTPLAAAAIDSVTGSQETALPEANEMNDVKSLQYSCSKFTGRIFIYDQDGQPLKVNFLPLDVEVGNLGDLPLSLQQPPLLHHLQRFVREWSSLSETKRRLIIKQGVTFSSPLLAYSQIRQESSSTQRHRSKEDTARLARKAAAAAGGTVRQVTRPGKRRQDDLCSYSYGQPGSREVKESADSPPASVDLPESTQVSPGLLQAVSKEGVPLCLHCGKEYQNPLLHASTITNPANAWQTRFCSWSCADKYWLQTRSGYCREEVFRAEHGVCQLCHVDTHAIFCRLRDTPDARQRLAVLKGSSFARLSAKQREQMVRSPKEGQFWQVDHIQPVFEGGGMCDIDNLRTLCTPCHQKVTAEQTQKRHRLRKLSDATQRTDITAFFQRC